MNLYQPFALKGWYKIGRIFSLFIFHKPEVWQRYVNCNNGRGPLRHYKKMFLHHENFMKIHNRFSSRVLTHSRMPGMIWNLWKVSLYSTFLIFSEREKWNKNSKRFLQFCQIKKMRIYLRQCTAWLKFRFFYHIISQISFSNTKFFVSIMAFERSDLDEVEVRLRSFIFILIFTTKNIDFNFNPHYVKL